MEGWRPTLFSVPICNGPLARHDCTAMPRPVPEKEMFNICIKNLIKKGDQGW
jgi:hypothetical protein